MQKKIILILLFALVVAIFAIQNSISVEIRLFDWRYNVSLAFVILGSIVLGALMVALVSSLSQLRLRKEINRLKKSKQELEIEIDELHEELERFSAEEDQEEMSNTELESEPNINDDTNNDNDIDSNNKDYTEASDSNSTENKLTTDKSGNSKELS